MANRARDEIIYIRVDEASGKEKKAKSQPER